MAILTLEGTAPQRQLKPQSASVTLKGQPYSVLGLPEKWDFGQGQSGKHRRNQFLRPVCALKRRRYTPPLRAGIQRIAGHSGKRDQQSTFGILGMVVAARQDAEETTAYMIPAEQLKDFLASLENVDLRNGVVDDFPHIREIEKYLRTNVVKKAAKGQQSFDLRPCDARTLNRLRSFSKRPEATYGPRRPARRAGARRSCNASFAVASPGGAGNPIFWRR